MHIDLIVIGGGAAGFFAALTAKKLHPQAKVLIVEKSAHLLNKVRISGGGRCNVTHSCFEPVPLSQNYPRGNKALIGPFTRFQPTHMIQWLKKRGVELKTEQDGRMFPITDNSQTIIDCFIKEAKELGVEIRQKYSIASIQKVEDGFILKTNNEETLECRKLLLCSGSSPQGHLLAQSFGHTIQPPVPSLFTFNVPSSPLLDLAGIAMNPAEIRITGTSFSQKGPVLITHWGFSGPAALKLSAWAARLLHEKDYQAQIDIDWLPSTPLQDVLQTLKDARNTLSGQSIGNNAHFGIPKNLWRKFLELSGIDQSKKFSQIPNDAYAKLAQFIKQSKFKVEGKTTYKDEFVTCGGVTLSEVNFKTMESKLCQGLFFAGEVLDVDAITGGFNFQNAWTTAHIAGSSVLMDNDGQ